MNKVGFIYTATIAQVCQPKEMLRFFEAVRQSYSANPAAPGVLARRLYKKYLAFEQLEEASDETDALKKTVTEGSVEWRICDAIKAAIQGVQYFGLNDGGYAPIRIAITDIPELFDDRFRDLSEYDNLEGPPFWLREYLQEYPNAELPF